MFLCRIHKNFPVIGKPLYSLNPMPLIQAIILEITILEAAFLPSLEVFCIPNEPSP